MLTADGKWIPEPSGETLINSVEELEAMVNERGFMPFFKCRAPGLSVEEYSPGDSWWSGNAARDPWEWRATVAERGNIAYAKVFENKAGFISREWYPLFASYRRSGYDFDSRWDDGMATRRDKLIMDVLENGDSLPSFELKRLAGFGKDGEKGFEGTMQKLMMQTYVTIRGFKRRLNSKGEEYGWPVALYSTPEALFGHELVASSYNTGTDEARRLLIEKLTQYSSSISAADARKLIG